MHDQSLEQRLRTALQAEGDRLAFTITAAELERRYALRVRGGVSPMASLGLAAAVGVALLAMVGVAGGWFDQRPAVVPPISSPISSPAPSQAPSALPSEGVARDTLPSLDELIGSRDPATIIRAQSVGPERGPEVVPATGIHSVIFPPVSSSVGYAVEIACLGSVDLQLQTVKSDPAVPGNSVPVICDGSPSSRFVDLAAGDSLAIKTSGSPSWRIVVSGPPTALAGAISDIVEAPAGDETLLDATSVGSGQPPETNPSTGLATWSIGGLPERGAFHITIACAGPRPVGYRIGGIEPGPAPDATTLTQVACDGAAHRDELDLATPAGTDVAVVADPGDSWRILVSAAKPPIAIAENGGGWGLSSALGPSYFTDGGPLGVSLVGAEADEPVRVVLSCAGEATLTGTIAVVVPIGGRPDPFTIDCSAQPAGAQLERVYPRGNQVSVETDPVGATMWLAVTTQVRIPPKPVP